MVVVRGDVVVVGVVVLDVVDGMLVVVGGLEVVVVDKLVVVGGAELVVVGGFVAVVDADGLEQPMPAASSENNTSAIDAAVKILFIVSPFPIFPDKRNILFVFTCYY